MKKFLIMLLLCNGFVAQASIGNWVRLVEQRPVIAAKALALVPLALGVLYFGKYSIHRGLEAVEAYEDHRIELLRSIGGPSVGHDEVMIHKSLDSLVAAALAIACAKLAHTCYQSLKDDIDDTSL